MKISESTLTNSLVRDKILFSSSVPTRPIFYVFSIKPYSTIIRVSDYNVYESRNPSQGRIQKIQKEGAESPTFFPFPPPNENFSSTWLCNYNNARRTVRRVGVVKKRFENTQKGRRGPLVPSPKSANTSYHLMKGHRVTTLHHLPRLQLQYQVPINIW